MNEKWGARIVLLAFVAIVGLAGCGHAAGLDTGLAQGKGTKAVRAQGKVELTVSAAASLTDSLKRIVPLFEAADPGIAVNVNYGGSGALRAQIEQGAPVDLFLSADTDNMQKLADQGLIAKQTPLLQGELVAIVPVNAKPVMTSPDDLQKPYIKAAAIGEPQTVPAGAYAKEALTTLGLWEPLQTRLVPARDVRQVLTYVETGNADVGFVYRTDAATSTRVKIAFVFDPATYRPIVYPVGLLRGSQHAAEAEKLYAYLLSQPALDVFAQAGFKPALH